MELEGYIKMAHFNRDGII